MPELINRDAFEKDLSEALSKILATARRNLVNDLYHEGFTQGELANVPHATMQALKDDLTRELQSTIPPVFVEVARDYAGLLSFALDESELQEKAQTWASSFIPKLVNGMLTTTTNELRRIASSAPNVQLSRRALLGMLGTVALFGLSRALTVSRTTATEVNSAAEDAINGELEATGSVVGIEQIWYTKKDEKVCPVCRPVHLTPKSSGAWPTDKPPAHPRCRCERKYKITYSDGTIVTVRSSEENGNPVSIAT